MGALFAKLLIQEGEYLVLELLRVVFWLSQWILNVVQSVVDLLLDAQVLGPPLLAREVWHRQIHPKVMALFKNFKNQ